MRENKIRPNEISTEAKVSMRTRIISAIVAAVIIVPFVFIGDWFLVILAGAIVGIGIFEIVHCAKKKYCIWLYIVTIILALLLTYWPIIYSGVEALIKHQEWSLASVFLSEGGYVKSTVLSISVLFIGVVALFILVIFDSSFEVRDACFIFTMTIIVSLGIQSILLLRFAPIVANPSLVDSTYFGWYNNFLSAMLFVYIVIGTIVTDIGAYFVGVFFGKNKINPRISPKKTWEGFVGGIVISALCSFGFGMIFAANNMPFLPGVLDLNHWYFFLILSLIIPFMGTLGDFVFSSLKRFYGIKDFGNIMPGHGGVLDRFDSLIFTSITATVFINLCYYWMPLVS